MTERHEGNDQRSQAAGQGEDSARLADSGWRLRPASLTPESADPLLGALLALCRLHGRPRSAASLTSGLPLENNRLTPEMFPVAAERARLSARLVRRKFADIQPHLFPVVLLLKGRSTYVVLREVKRDQFEVMVPETGSGTEIVSRQHIEERYDGYAFLARPEISYRGKTETTEEPPRGNWFWATLRRMGRVYVYVILAAIMVNLFALAGPLFTMNVYDRVVPNQALETLWVLAAGVLIVYGFDFVLKMVRAYLIDHTGKRADVVMSSIIFSHALNVRMGSRPASSGAFANKLKEFEAVRDFFASATVVAIVDIPFIFLFIGVIYVIAGPSAYVLMVAVPVVIIGGLLLQAPLRQAVRKTNAGNAHKHGVLIEAISGLDTIKSLGAEGRMQRDWEAFSGESADLGARVKFLSGLGIHFSQFVQQVVTIAVVIIGVYQISTNELTMGGLIAATILTGRVMGPLGQIAGLVARLHHAASARKSIDEIMALPVDRPAGKQFLSRPALAGRIDFQDVTFFYPDTQTPAVKNLSFSVRPGERLAIMGPIGSGKSTIARLLTRLYDPTEGSIQIDGADVQQIDPADIRRTAGVVLQDIILFTGTVRENIAMGAPEADDDMILRAAELSGAHDFISRHPLGYDMPVGERGSLLSGGQRQAVALARALLPDPPILVLDEPTSMMDIPAEEGFVNRLSQSLKDKALIIVTHRPSLLNIADRLLVMRRGEAIADGPVREVLPKLGARIPAVGLPSEETIKAHLLPQLDKEAEPPEARQPSPAAPEAPEQAPAADRPAVARARVARQQSTQDPQGPDSPRRQRASGRPVLPAASAPSPAKPAANQAANQASGQAVGQREVGRNGQRAPVSSRVTAPPAVPRRTEEKRSATATTEPFVKTAPRPAIRSTTRPTAETTVAPSAPSDPERRTTAKAPTPDTTPARETAAQAASNVHVLKPTPRPVSRPDPAASDKAAPVAAEKPAQTSTPPSAPTTPPQTAPAALGDTSGADSASSDESFGLSPAQTPRTPAAKRTSGSARARKPLMAAVRRRPIDTVTPPAAARARAAAMARWQTPSRDDLDSDANKTANSRPDTGARPITAQGRRSDRSPNNPTTPPPAARRNRWTPWKS